MKLEYLQYCLPISKKVLKSQQMCDIINNNFRFRIFFNTAERKPLIRSRSDNKLSNSNEKIRIAFISLGCQKNLIDSEIMMKKLSDAGIEIVEDDINADVVVVNTCGFIESAKKRQ